jgi:hypothetical protein
MIRRLSTRRNRAVSAPAITSSITRLMASQMPETKVVIYLLRKDLRVSDNPILHALSTNPNHDFTHLLPLYVFQAQQLEVKGFIADGEAAKSPYPEARSQVARFWRTGPHRVKFLSESVWDTKKSLEALGSKLCVRVGMADGVLKHLINEINQKSGTKVAAVWMTAEEGVEEKREERAIRKLCEETDTDFKLFVDEKFFIDESVQVAPIISDRASAKPFTVVIYPSATLRMLQTYLQNIATKLSLFEKPPALSSLLLKRTHCHHTPQTLRYLRKNRHLPFLILMKASLLRS